MEEFAGWPLRATFRQHCAAFTPFVCRQVTFPACCGFSAASLVGAGEEVVEVACCPRSSEFSGDARRSESISMKLGSYLQGFEACQRGEKHWIMEIPEIDLYLSQLTVLSSSVAAASSTSGLLLLTQRDLPPLLCPQDSQEGEEVHEANVWANINPVSSSLHYDGNHNLLYVSSGCKVVLLVSPRHTALLRPSAAHASTPNHSALSRDQLVHILPCLQQQKNQHQEEGCRTIDAFQVTVHAGDCLFIPEGWWHQVSSEAGTFAVNFWFRSPLHALLRLPFSSQLQPSHSPGPALAPYLLRSSVHTLLTAEIRAMTWEEGRGLPQGTGACSFSVEDFGYPEALFRGEDQQQQQLCLGDLCRCFASATLADMRTYWSTFASRNVHIWASVMLHLSAKQCFRLVRTWEQQEQEKEPEPKQEGVVACRSAATTSTQVAGAPLATPSAVPTTVQDLCHVFLVAAVAPSFSSTSADNIRARVKEHVIASKELFVKRLLEEYLLPALLEGQGADSSSTLSPPSCPPSSHIDKKQKTKDK